MLLQVRRAMKGESAAIPTGKKIGFWSGSVNYVLRCFVVVCVLGMSLGGFF